MLWWVVKISGVNTMVGGEAQFFHPAMPHRMAAKRYDNCSLARDASRAHLWTPVKVHVVPWS